MATPDYYAALEVARDASSDDLKRAYRKMVVAYHPDRLGGDAETTRRFQAIVEAYSILSDPGKRLTYDEGHIIRGVRFEKGGDLREFVGGFFDKMLGVRPKRPMRGFDHIYRLSISFSESCLGTTRALQIPCSQTCSECAGRGFPLGTLPDLCERCDGLGELRRRKMVRSEFEQCPDCSGRGYTVPHPCDCCAGHGLLSETREVSIAVPPGVENETKLLVRGAGQPGWQGGEHGDCWVHLGVKPDPSFKKAGLDLHSTRPIPLFQALTGGTLTIPTLEGPVNIKVPPFSLQGPPLRLAGYGARSPETGVRGDHLVHLEVELPTSLPPEVARHLKACEKLLGPEAFPKSQAFSHPALSEDSTRDGDDS